MATIIASQRHADYTVACICPMAVELAPVKALLDHIHPDLPVQRDQNSYVLGDMAGHNVVITILPEIGNTPAAVIATQLLNDFPSVRFGLLVGIGGGVPDLDEEESNDVRLGDVVISKPTQQFGGVVQYDLGKSMIGGFEKTGTLDKPPPILRSAVEKLAADHRMKGSQVAEHLSAMFQKYPFMEEEYSHPGVSSDILFRADYPHVQGRTCRDCDKQHTVKREERRSKHPRFHYGTIGSANTVVKDAMIRDQLRQQFGVKCVEMEAAGLMDSFPCLVIRGVCDYADSHKNKKWQPYAAAVAAAYMKELLSMVLPKDTAFMAPALDLVEVQRYDRGLNLFDAPDIGADDLFIGREPELDRMQTYLEPGSKSSNRKVLVLGGIGGIGKTQLAIAYAKRYRDLYSSIFWLNAESETTLKNSFRTVANRTISADTAIALPSACNTEHQQNLVLNWFSMLENRDWLLIYDNYDDPDQYDISRYYPYVSHGSIIVTTRLPDKVGTEPLILRSLNSLDDSLRILQKRSGRERIEDDVPARLLAKRLRGLPLALATAGAFLHKDKSMWTFEKYLNEYERRWNVDPRRQLKLHEYQNRTLYTTWDLSYRRLAQEDPEAAQLLKLLAYFDHQHIWAALFQAGVQDSLPKWLVAIGREPAEFESAMRVLVGYCFLEVQATTQSYGLHTCVHDWILASLNAVVEPWSYWFSIDCIYNSISGREFKVLAETRYSWLATHAAWLTHSRFHEVGQAVTEDCLHKPAHVARLLSEHYRFDAAIVMQERSLVGMLKIRGHDDLRTLDVLNALGVAHQGNGALAKAEEVFTQALTRTSGTTKEPLEEYSSMKITLTANLGILYRRQGRLAEAEMILLQVLAKCVGKLGPDHVDTLKILHNLALVNWEQGKLERAAQMYAQVLVGQEKAHDRDYVAMAKTANDLAITWQRLGRLSEAEEIHKIALYMFEATLGQDHPLALATLNNLGLLYCRQGRLAEAEETFVRTLTRAETAARRDHLTTLALVANIAALYADQGKLLDAEKMFDRALRGYEAILGPTHSKTRMITDCMKRLRPVHAATSISSQGFMS